MLWKKFVPVQLCPQQSPLLTGWDQTQAPTVMRAVNSWLNHNTACMTFRQSICPVVITNSSKFRKYCTGVSSRHKLHARFQENTSSGSAAETMESQRAQQSQKPTSFILVSKVGKDITSKWEHATYAPQTFHYLAPHTLHKWWHLNWNILTVTVK